MGGWARGGSGARGGCVRVRREWGEEGRVVVACALVAGGTGYEREEREEVGGWVGGRETFWLKSPQELPVWRLGFFVSVGSIEACLLCNLF